MYLVVLDAPPRWRRSQLAEACVFCRKGKRVDGTSARLTACVLDRASIRHQSDSNRLQVPTLFTTNRHHQATTRKHGFYNGSAGPQLLDLTYYLATSLILNCRRFCDNCQRRLAMRMFRPPQVPLYRHSNRSVHIVCSLNARAENA